MDGRPAAGPRTLTARLGQNTLSLRSLLHLPALINHRHWAFLAIQLLETSVLSLRLPPFSTGSRMATTPFTTHLSLPMPKPTGLSICLNKKNKNRKKNIKYISKAEASQRAPGMGGTARWRQLEGTARWRQLGSTAITSARGYSDHVSSGVQRADDSSGVPRSRSARGYPSHLHAA